MAGLSVMGYLQVTEYFDPARQPSWGLELTLWDYVDKRELVYVDIARRSGVGYILGGWTDANTAVIEDLIFATETSQAIAATLDTAKSYGAGVNSATKGYILGGEESGGEYIVVIEDLIFATETSQAIAATLDMAKSVGAGVQNGFV